MTKHEGMAESEARRSRIVTAKRLRHIAKGWTPQAAYPGGSGAEWRNGEMPSWGCSYGESTNSTNSDELEHRRSAITAGGNDE